jgi:hypothetical protein
VQNFDGVAIKYGDDRAGTVCGEDRTELVQADKDAYT